jgi:subtilisin-like proprotein convertase family protein
MDTTPASINSNAAMRAAKRRSDIGKYGTRAAAVGLLAVGLMVGGDLAGSFTAHDGGSSFAAQTAEARRSKKKSRTVTKTFAHPDPVGISSVGPSKEYPAAILVEGLRRGRVLDVNVRFPGFSHDLPDDVDILLVGPDGKSVVLMSDAGGDVVGTQQFDVTFDDEATSSMPDGGQLFDQSYIPVNFVGNDPEGRDLFPAPAPLLTDAAALSVFDGSDPNGAWRLYIVDDAADNGGVLLGGWSLEITARVRR